MPKRETLRLMLQAKRALEAAIMFEMGVGEVDADIDEPEGYSRSGKRKQDSGSRGQVVDPENDKRVKYKERYQDL